MSIKGPFYGRVSSDGQADDISLETQLDSCSQFAGTAGYWVAPANVYRETASGTNGLSRRSGGPVSGCQAKWLT